MPLASCGCSNGLLVTAVVAFLLFPTQYLIPDLSVEDEIIKDESYDESLLLQVKSRSQSWLDLILLIFPPLDLFLTTLLLIISVLIYFCEWIQRKLMERRMVKLNEYLLANVERLKEWDAQQEQLESTLKMVQNATSEYNLLLYLMLRQQNLSTKHGPSTECFFEKNADDLTMLRNPVEEMY